MPRLTDLSNNHRPSGKQNPYLALNRVEAREGKQNNGSDRAGRAACPVSAGLLTQHSHGAMVAPLKPSGGAVNS